VPLEQLNPRNIINLLPSRPDGAPGQFGQ